MNGAYAEKNLACKSATRSNQKHSLKKDPSALDKRIDVWILDARDVFRSSLLWRNRMYHNPRFWCCASVAQAVEALEFLRDNLPNLKKTTQHWLGQSCSRANLHLEGTDFSQSEFLCLLGIKVIRPYVFISLCEDGLVIIEYMILGDDGSFYSRHEALSHVPWIPTPEQIKEECRKIRERVPWTSYNDQWTGTDGPKIREYLF